MAVPQFRFRRVAQIRMAGTELVILVARLALYPTGLIQEERPGKPVDPADPEGRDTPATPAAPDHPAPKDRPTPPGDDARDENDAARERDATQEGHATQHRPATPKRHAPADSRIAPGHLTAPPAPEPSNTAATAATANSASTPTTTGTAIDATVAGTTDTKDAPSAPTAPDTSRPPDTRAPRDRPDRRDGREAFIPAPAFPPVLLLHGFVDNRSVFALLRRSLARHGWRHVHALNYSPLTRDVRTAALLLGRHVEQLCDHTGQPRVDIVGHSLGGLIARYYVQRLDGHRWVRTVVTLGTPHSGTRVGSIFDPHPVVRQMRPGSPLLAELAAPAPHCTTRFIAFWSDLDQIMSPVETARLDHPDLDVRNVLVPGVGHLTLPVHSGVAKGIRQALTEDPAARSDVEAGCRKRLETAPHPAGISNTTRTDVHAQ